MIELANNNQVGATGVIRILNEITRKLTNTSNWVYKHGEDDRLSAAVLSILQRRLIEPTTIKKRLASLTTPKNVSWKGAWKKEESTRAFFNVRNFLRSLYLQIATEEGFENRMQYQGLVLEAIQSLRPY